MDPCMRHRAIIDNYTVTSLDPEDMALPKIGNNFPFRVLNEGSNIELTQTTNGIVVSTPDPTQVKVSVGLNSFSTTGIISNIPLIFSNQNIPGYVNSGFYNESTGVALVPITGLYKVFVQLTMTSGTPIVGADIIRGIGVQVNGTDYQLIRSYKNTDSNVSMTVSYSNFIPLTAGDVVTFLEDVGQNTITVVTLGGSNSYMSMSLLP